MANNQIIPITYDSIAAIQGIATINLVREAIQSRKCLSIQYGGHHRVVEVHAVGITKDGNPIVKAWQVSGESQSGNPTPWKHFRLDRASFISLSDQDSEAPRDGYVPDDRCFNVIFAQV